MLARERVNPYLHNNPHIHQWCNANKNIYLYVLEHNDINVPSYMQNSAERLFITNINLGKYYKTCTDICLFNMCCHVASFNFSHKNKCKTSSPIHRALLLTTIPCSFFDFYLVTYISQALLCISPIFHINDKQLHNINAHHYRHTKSITFNIRKSSS